MVDMPTKVREARLRRAASRQGLRLEKSRRRDPRALDYGVYWLVDAETGVLVEGPYRKGFRDLDEVERCLADGPDTDRDDRPAPARGEEPPIR